MEIRYCLSCGKSAKETTMKYFDVNEDKVLSVLDNTCNKCYYSLNGKEKREFITNRNQLPKSLLIKKSMDVWK